MNIFKKNQVVVFVIALMLITAGYLNFVDNNDKTDTTIASTDSKDIGDAVLVSSNSIIVEEKIEELTEEVADDISSEKNALNNIVEEHYDDYYTNTRLERDNMYSQIIESYQKIINSEAITAEQKAIAQNEITKINNTKNAIMIAENLIKTKGFEEAIILVNSESINVIVPNEKLKHEEIAQIQNIVSREMKAEIENIHISSKQM